MSIYKNKSISLVKTALVIGMLGVSYSVAAASEYGVSISSGSGSADITAFRLGVLKYWKKTWLKENTWSFRGYWEASAYHMKGDRGPLPGSNNSLQAVALAGVVRYERNSPIGGLWPYIDLGVGGSYVSKTEIGGRRLGIHFQFEDRAGIGVRFGERKEFEVGYRFVHFSNAFMAWYNHGINIHTLVFNYWL